jgi:hypothetical protein
MREMAKPIEWRGEGGANYACMGVRFASFEQVVLVCLNWKQLPTWSLY